MTIKEIQDRIEKIRALDDDDERQHRVESYLHRDVLRAIADGTCEDPAACAREAMKTWDLPFERWYA